MNPISLLMKLKHLNIKIYGKANNFSCIIGVKYLNRIWAFMRGLGLINGGKRCSLTFVSNYVTLWNDRSSDMLCLFFLMCTDKASHLVYNR